MAAVEAMGLPEIAAKVVAFVAKAVLLVPAAARRHRTVMAAYETSLLLAELPDLLSQSSHDDGHFDELPPFDELHPCVFCRLHDSRP